MIQTKLSPSRLWLLIATIAGLCTSCSDITDSGGDTSLPDGKYPMTFSAAVDGLTVSRTTSGKDAWTKDDPIAVSINESSDSKTYQITDASTGAMEPVNPSDVYYWKTNTEELKILAWYPAEAVTAKDISDQSQGFADFDYLKAEKTAKFSAGGVVSLSFAHQMAKVTYTLTTDNSTTTDVTKATVSIYGYTKASFAKGIVGKVENSNGWITPTTDKEVLVVPQDMKGQQFIRVTISGREYFYTPGENDANLEAGKQYNYTIKVNETGLESVTVNTYPSWTEGSSAGGGEGTEATFRVYLPEDHGLTADNVTGATQVGTSNVYEISNHSKTFSISYTLTGSGPSKGFFISKGLGDCKVVSHADSGGQTYTFTYSNIRTDIWLVRTSYAEVGYYYYADGTCSPTYNSSGSPACIGVVFKVGAADGDNVPNYAPNAFTDNVIHGYVVALRDAHTGTCIWGGKGTLIGTSTNQDDFAGYSNTQKVIAEAIKRGQLKPDGKADRCYPAAYYISEYRKIVKVPANTSGWYFPSTGQLKEIYNAKDNIHTDVLMLQSDEYLSSSEYSNYTVGYVSFNDGTSGYREKHDLRYVRAILTF